MEVGNDCQRHCSEVSFAELAELKFKLVDPGVKTNDDAYSSDGESSHSGCTDLSVSSVSISPTNDKVVKEPSLEVDLSNLLGAEIHELALTIPQFINSRIECGYEVGSFLVTDLAQVVRQLEQWRHELPMVEPFYAVKCNPDPVIVKLLASLGCSFDCATMGEIDLVLNGLGDKLSLKKQNRAASSVVYANPAKMQHMLEFAIENDVRMTVFDGEDELLKIAATEGHEKLQLLLRLTTDDTASVCRFSKKFGCPVAEAPRLLDVAQSLGLNVAGVSFHVGSGCGDSSAYSTALSHTRMVFDEAEKRGMPAMTIVDLGGGFPGGVNGDGGIGRPTFQNLAAAIRVGIETLCRDLNRDAGSIRFIAEPGRYFVHACTTLATKVYSRKGGMNKYQAIYVDDGVYGSFNNVIYDHAFPVPQKLSQVLAGVEEERIPSAVFGPTCDGLDQMCSLETTTLPRVEVGEWLIWDEMGSYTHTASFVFNGYTHVPKKTYCFKK